jgi:hypothetical protein
MVAAQSRHSRVVETALSIHAVDGYPLAATRFSPIPLVAKKLVVVNGATSVPARSWRHERCV